MARQTTLASSSSSAGSKIVWVASKIDVMDEKMLRHFRWQTGILLSSLIAMMGTLGGIIAVLLRQS